MMTPPPLRQRRCSLPGGRARGFGGWGGGVAAFEEGEDGDSSEEDSSMSTTPPKDRVVGASMSARRAFTLEEYLARVGPRGRRGCRSCSWLTTEKSKVPYRTCLGRQQPFFPPPFPPYQPSPSPVFASARSRGFGPSAITQPSGNSAAQVANQRRT